MHHHEYCFSVYIFYFILMRNKLKDIHYDAICRRNTHQCCPRPLWPASSWRTDVTLAQLTHSTQGVTPRRQSPPIPNLAPKAVITKLGSAKIRLDWVACRAGWAGQGRGEGTIGMLSADEARLGLQGSLILPPTKRYCF